MEHWLSLADFVETRHATLQAHARNVRPDRFEVLQDGRHWGIGVQRRSASVDDFRSNANLSQNVNVPNANLSNASEALLTRKNY